MINRKTGAQDEVGQGVFYMYGLVQTTYGQIYTNLLDVVNDDALLALNAVMEASRTGEVQWGVDLQYLMMK